MPSVSSAAVAVNAEQAVNAQTAASDSKRKRAHTSRCSKPVVKPTRNAETSLVCQILLTVFWEKPLIKRM